MDLLSLAEVITTTTTITTTITITITITLTITFTLTITITITLIHHQVPPTTLHPSPSTHHPPP